MKMTLEDAISTIELKQKLMNLNKVMLDATEPLYEFAKLLADKLGPTTSPVNFYLLSSEQIYEDLNRAIGSKSKKLPTIIRMQIPEIAEAVCPKDFADNVKEIYRQINKATD